MAGFSMSVLSTQLVQVPVRAWVDGQPYNPTADAVQMAFVTGWTDPTSMEWNTGSWAGTSAVNGYYLAQCLVGPANGGVALAIGLYNVWVKITDNPEIPVQNPGTLTITA